MKKRVLALTLGVALAVGALTGCSGSKNEDTQDTAAVSEKASEEKNDDGSAAEAEASGEYDFTKDPISLKIGVVGSVYEDIWQPTVDKLKDEGIELEVVQFSDYVTPNNALNNGEIDLNAFQHQIYLNSEIESYGYEIQNIGNTFIIPLNVYSDKIKSLDELKDGDTVAVPNDLTNEGRALKVLAKAGVITLKDNDNFNPTLDDIESYNKNITIEELSANTIPSVLPDVTAAVINGNYALDFGLKTEEAIYKDSVLDEEKYWNLIAARTEDLSDPRLKAAYKKIVDTFHSDDTKKVCNNI